MDNLIEGKSYRLVVQRTPLKDKHGREQTDMFGVIYTYRCILTNNWMSTEKDIITFYNERGASEKNFDIQNNDFGWSHLPFSFMAENMVFMMVTAMLKFTILTQKNCNYSYHWHSRTRKELMWHWFVIMFTSPKRE